MTYLLDTCVLSELAKPAPNKRVLEWLEGCEEESLYLSVLTVGEIQKGIARLAAGRRKNALQQWLDRDLLGRFSGRILPVDEETALTWGVAQAAAERRGTPVATVDGLIGATAVAHNLVVVTRNEADLKATGAQVLNPWSAGTQ